MARFQEGLEGVVGGCESGGLNLGRLDILNLEDDEELDADPEYLELEKFSQKHRTLAIAWSPETSLNVFPKTVAFCSAASDHKLRLYNSDLAVNSTVQELRGHTDYINAVAYDPYGEYVVSTSDDHTCRVWSLKELPGQCITNIRLLSPGTCSTVNTIPGQSITNIWLLSTRYMLYCQYYSWSEYYQHLAIVTRYMVYCQYYSWSEYHQHPAIVTRYMLYCQYYSWSEYYQHLAIVTRYMLYCQYYSWSEYYQHLAIVTRYMLYYQYYSWSEYYQHLTIVTRWRHGLMCYSHAGLRLPKTGRLGFDPGRVYQGWFFLNDYSLFLHANAGMSVACHQSEEGKLLVGEKCGVLSLFNLVSGQAILSFDSNRSPLLSADWSPNTSLYAVAVVAGEIVIWDTTNPRWTADSSPTLVCNEVFLVVCCRDESSRAGRVQQADAHVEGSECVKFSPLNHSYIATIGQPKHQLKITHLASPHPILVTNLQLTGGLTWHYRLPYVCVGNDRKLCMWKIATK
uniref:Uncharacterized protein n=1 Tax=Timema genevievae TaxID=629358 RepID=A0A7R9K2A6_TIMGE|nr:unnamed protein product [Timema genevievae]